MATLLPSVLPQTTQLEAATAHGRTGHIPSRVTITIRPIQTGRTALTESMFLMFLDELAWALTPGVRTAAGLTIQLLVVCEPRTIA
jgi:hypothetical protein